MPMPSGFVSVPSPPDPGSPNLVQNDGWYPDVDIILLRDSARIDPNITTERLREAVVNAIGAVRDQLAAWRVVQELALYTKLDDVPAPQIGGESRLLGLYRRAVQSMTVADLVDRLRDIGTTKAGHDRADELEDVGCVHLRNARYAIADILGVGRTAVELI